MFVRRLFFTVFTLYFAVVLIGCKSAAPNLGRAAGDTGARSANRPSATAQGSQVPSTSSSESPQTASPTAEPSSAALLARRAEAYAQEIQQQLDARAQSPRGATGGAVSGTESGTQVESPAPSAVQWPQPQSSSQSRPPSEQIPVAQAPAAPVAAIGTSSSPLTPAPIPGVPPSSVAAAPPPAATPRLAAAAVPVASVTPNEPVAMAPSPAVTEFNAAATPRTKPPSAPGITVAALEQRLLERIHENPRDVSGQLDYQLLRFVQDQPVPDMAAIAALPSEDRDLLTVLLDGLSNFRSTVRADYNMLLSRKVRPLLDAADRLRSQSDLTISAMALCTRIRAFGNYDPVESPRFVAGHENETILYVAIDNFASTLNDKQMWETRLGMACSLFDDTGPEVWTDKVSQVTDASRQRRHDFFIGRVIRLPAAIPVGRYILKVTITDEQANRIAESTMRLQIVAQ